MINNETKEVLFWTIGVVVGTSLTLIASPIGIGFAGGCVIGLGILILKDRRN